MKLQVHGQARGAQAESDSARGVSQGTQYQEPVAAAASQADTEGAASDTAVPPWLEAAEPDSRLVVLVLAYCHLAATSAGNLPLSSTTAVVR